MVNADDDENDVVVPKGAIAQVNNNVSKIATDPKKGTAMLLIFAVVVLGGGYKFIDNSKKVKNAALIEKPTFQEKEVPRPAEISSPSSIDDTAIASTAMVSSLGDLKIDADQNKPVEAAPLPRPKKVRVTTPTLPTTSPMPIADASVTPVPTAPVVISQAPVEAVPMMDPNSGGVPPQVSAEPSISVVGSTTPSMTPDAGVANVGATPALPSQIVDPNQQQQVDARKKSAIMLINNVAASQGVGGTAGGAPGTSGATGADGSPVVMSNGVVETLTTAPMTLRTREMQYVLSKGKMIKAILETAVNSEIAAAGTEIRAVVSQDVYGNDGKIVLIPRGARIFGTASGTDSLYGRMSIAWSRIDFASGYSLAFSGAAVDKLGRTGTVGRLDNKYDQKFKDIVLETALNISFINLVNKIVTPATSYANTTALLAQGKNMISYTNAQYATCVKTITSSATDFSCASSVCNIAKSALTDTTTQYYTAVNSICGALKDTTSAIVVNVVLNNVNTSLTFSATDSSGAQTQSVQSELITMANNMMTSTSSSSTATAAQTAAAAGITSFQDALKSVIASQTATASVSLDQGQEITIYVNTDYKFPADALHITNQVIK